MDDYLQKGQIDRDVILITGDDIQRIKTLYAQNWNEEPKGDILENLIDQYVSAEIYYREALKLNLDHNDEIIKRRLKQKYEFLAQDLADLQEPPDDSLNVFYNENISEYQSTKKFSFFHFFINPDYHDDPDVRAIELLNLVRHKTPDAHQQIGDPSHIPVEQNKLDLADIRRIFGLGFADQFGLVGELGWQPVFQSGLGYHLVYINDIDAEEVRPYAQVRDQVLLDWQATNRRRFKEALDRDLKKNYEVIIQYEE